MPTKTIKIGSRAPDFCLPSTEGEPISLKDYRNKNIVVLFFYPKDSTPGCTKEACSFGENIARFRKKGAVILGLSKDNLNSHRKFIEKYDLPFPLLSDEDSAVAKAYGVHKQKSLYGRKFWGIERSTFVIGKDGKIKHAFRKVQIEGHTDEVYSQL